VTFGKPVSVDDGDGEFVFGSSNVRPMNSQKFHNDGDGVVARQLAIDKGFDTGTIVGKIKQKDQVKNPWTWGIVIFVTSSLHVNDIKPLGIAWLSDGPSRGITHCTTDDVFIVQKAPDPEVLTKIMNP
jgi:hypothetical protein